MYDWNVTARVPFRLGWVVAIALVCACRCGPSRIPPTDAGEESCLAACVEPLVCEGNGCVPESCVGVDCAEGERCGRGLCYPANCQGHGCAPAEVCVNGACALVACLGVACPVGERCGGGRCLPKSCGAAACSDWEVCENGACVFTACAGIRCPAGFLCAGGTCAPTECQGLPCAAGEACIDGACADPRCVGVTCPDTHLCQAGHCMPAYCDPVEKCGNLFDDDCDGLVDCADSDCALACSPPSDGGLDAGSDGGDAGTDAGSWSFACSDAGPNSMCNESWCWEYPGDSGFGDWGLWGGQALLYGTSSSDLWWTGTSTFRWNGSRMVPGGVQAGLGDPFQQLSAVHYAGSGGVWGLSPLGGLRRLDGGEWELVTQGVLGLGDLWVGGPSEVWAAGGFGLFNSVTAFLRHWNGSSWANYDDSDAGIVWRSIHGSASNDVWVVGSALSCAHWNGQEWTQPTQTPSSFDSFVGVYAADPGHAWAVSSAGKLVQLHASPQGNWLEPKVLLTDAGFSDIWGSSASDVWAAGSGGRLLHWDGREWLETCHLTSASLARFWGFSSTDLWVTGNSPEVLLHWNGLEWRKVQERSATTLVSGGYERLWANDAGLWAVGSAGRLDHFDGGEWSAHSAPSRPPTVEDLRAVSANIALGANGTVLQQASGEWTACRSGGETLNAVAEVGPFSEEVYVGADGGIYISTCAGYESSQSPPNPGSPLFGVWGTGGYLPGGGSDFDIWAVGAGGRILYSTHFFNFQGVASPTVEDLYAVSGTSKTDVWAVGSNKTILHWDGGVWASVTNALPVHSLRAVWANKSDDVWVAGLGATVWRWNGTDWADMVPPFPPSINLSVHGLEATDVFVGGAQAIIRWNGANWSTTFSGGGGWWLGGGGGLPLWAVGNGGAILQWTGSEWKQPGLTADSLRSVHGSARDDVWAAGEKSALLHWNGQQWRSTFAPTSAWTTTTFGSVWTAGPQAAWAATQAGEVFRWNGTAWAADTGVSGARALWGFSASDVWGVGPAGLLLHWNGQLWAAGGDGGTENLVSVWGLAPSQVWAGSQTGAVLSWNGTNWNALPSPGSGFSVTDLWGRSATDLWAALFIPQTTGVAAHWNGTEWTSFNLGFAITSVRGDASGTVYFGTRSRAQLRHTPRP